jgi:non-specific serine/threonine protein kinase
LKQGIKDSKELIAIFNEKSFILDFQALDKSATSEEYIKAQEEWYERFLEDKYKALWDLGFESKKYWMSQSLSFLNYISEGLIAKLSKQSDIEFTRENADLNLSIEELEAISKKLPFSIGSEFINNQWIKANFEKIAEVYRREILSYHGSVNAIFLERNSNINVVGRVFFHLVENKEDKHPFAFLATYSTEDKEKGIKKAKHMPLKNALLEYK